MTKSALRREYFSRNIFVVANTLFLIVLVLMVVIPIYKVLIDSLDVQPGSTVLRALPGEFTIEGYANILKRDRLYRPFLISVFTTVTGMIIAMTFTTFFSYGLAQRDLPGKRLFLYMALITMVFRAGMIPLFIVMRDLKLLNTLFAVLLVSCVDAYYLLLLRNFFQTIPVSIIDAAEIDGCTPFGTFWRIILPLSKPGLAAIGLFYVVFYWNQFFDFIIYIQQKPELHNFQVFLRTFVVEGDTQNFEGFVKMSTETLQNAAIVVSIVPVLILYPFIQKYFVKGINLGAVKG